MNSVECRQKIELYGAGFALLSAALADLPREAWQHRPAPAEWCIHEIVVHLADSESMAALRARKLITEPGSWLMGYEEARWADALQYSAQNADNALRIIQLVRQTTYELLRTLPDAAFDHAVRHEEYEQPYTFDMWLDIYSRHIPEHIEQIQRAREAWRLATQQPDET